jgi:outer membrane protein OmpA-like peptidoglycan-associated protein
MSLWLAPVALAAPLHGMVELRMEGVVAEPEGADVSGLGGGLGVGLQAKGPLWVELSADLTAPSGGPGRLGLGGNVRLFAMRRDGVPMALSFVGGGGYNVRLVDAEIPAGFVRVGAAVDLRPAPAVGVRVSGAWLPMLEAGRSVVHGAELGLGLVFTPGKRTPEEVVEAPPAPPPISRTWLPFPECRWSTTEVDGAAASRRVGGLVVGACAGDQVTVGGEALETDAAGIAETFALASGLVDLRVVGGGREAPRRLGFVQGQALWVVFDCPTDQVVYFDLGSAVLGDRTAADVARWASLAGDWRAELRGSYSPEGDEAANLALADSRARAVQAALVAAGMRADRVAIGDPMPPDALKADTPERLRRVTIRWVAPVVAP